MKGIHKTGSHVPTRSQVMLSPWGGVWASKCLFCS